MERYEHLIVGTYYGHTHNDEILVLYNKDKQNNTYPVSHAYLGSSLTSYSALNPGYRVFTLDNTVFSDNSVIFVNIIYNYMKSYGKPLDFVMYYSNVTEDNIEGQKVVPKWTFGYSAKESYGLDSLSTKSWDQFITRAETDDNLTKTYFQHYYRFNEAYIKVNPTTIDQMIENLQKRRKINPIYDNFEDEI